MILLNIFPPDHLRCAHLYYCLLQESEICLVWTIWTPILVHIFVWYDKPYLKNNIVGFPPPDNFPYHLINLFFAFICKFLYIIDISSWCLSSKSCAFRFMVPFHLWFSHWVFYSLLRNIIPWYGVSRDISQIGRLVVNDDRIHRCVITVLKMIKYYRESLAPAINFLKGRVFFFSCFPWLTRE